MVHIFLLFQRIPLLFQAIRFKYDRKCLVKMEKMIIELTCLFSHHCPLEHHGITEHISLESEPVLISSYVILDSYSKLVYSQYLINKDKK
jgi:hypothetical protein